MTVQSITERDRASREAIDWLILLNDDPSDEELRRGFASWLAESPMNVEAWSLHAGTYEILGAAPKEFDAYWPGIPRHRRNPIVARRKSGWRLSSRLFVAAVAMACLGIVIVPYASVYIRADGITSAAEIRRYPLPDGSMAVLAPDTAVAIDFADQRRDVRLLKGEAFFQVVHDRLHPFKVSSGSVETTVLGTEFDVKLRDDGVRVGVREGHVRVDHGAGSDTSAEHVLPGEWAQVNFNGTVERGRQQAALSASWMDRRLVVNDRPIVEAIRDIRPWFAGTIVLVNHRLGASRVTGSVDTARPAEAVRSLVQVHGGKVYEITPWLIVIS